MKRVFFIATLAGFMLQANAQETQLPPKEVKKENAATAVEEKEVAAEKSEAIQAIEQGKSITVKSNPAKTENTKNQKDTKTTNSKSKVKSNPEAPLSPAEVKKENAATAIEEKEVAAEKSEALQALEQGKEITVRDTTENYTATSKVENSGFQRTVGFDGAWKFDMNLNSKEIVLTGGTLSNKGTTTSNNLRLMVYLAQKPFDLNNPEFIGEVYSVLDVNPVAAGDTKTGQAYVMNWASETNPAAGTYYPYILLGEQNPQTQEFEVKDVKAFDKSITITD